MYKYQDYDEQANAYSNEAPKKFACTLEPSKNMKKLIEERRKIFNFNHVLKNNNIPLGLLHCKAEIIPCGTTWTVGRIEFKTQWEEDFKEATDEPYFRLSALLETFLFDSHRDEIDQLWHQQEAA